MASNIKGALKYRGCTMQFNENNNNERTLYNPALLWERERERLY